MSAQRGTQAQQDLAQHAHRDLTRACLAAALVSSVLQIQCRAQEATTFRIVGACQATVASTASAQPARREPSQKSLVVLLVPSVAPILILLRVVPRVGIVNARRDSNKLEKIALPAA